MLEIKRKSLERIKEEIGKLKDKTGRPVEPYIKELVIGLWWCGINTESSCQGHINRGSRFPWVDIPYSETEKLAIIVSWQNKPRYPNGRKNKNIWVIKPGLFVRLMPKNPKLPLRKLQKRAIEFGLFLQNLPQNWIQEKYLSLKIKPLSMSTFVDMHFLFSGKARNEVIEYNIE